MPTLPGWTVLNGSLSGSACCRRAKGMGHSTCQATSPVRIRTIASQAIASPRPTAHVLAGLGLDVDRGGEPEQYGEVGSDVRLVGPELRLLGVDDTSQLPTFQPAPATSRRPGRSRALSSPPLRVGVGKSSPMSPRAAAPSRASATAWSTTSASEWPNKPRDGHPDPAQDQRPPLHQSMRVVSEPYSHRQQRLRQTETPGPERRHDDIPRFTFLPCRPTQFPFLTSRVVSFGKKKGHLYKQPTEQNS